MCAVSANTRPKDSGASRTEHSIGADRSEINEKSASQIVAQSGGVVTQSVTYDELRGKLDPADMQYISAREQALNNHFTIWTVTYPQLSLMVDPIARAKVQLQLDQLTRDMGNEMTAILGFLENRLGLRLDDHYQAIRQIAQR